MTIKVFKLVSGEEVIGEVIVDDHPLGRIELRKPRLLTVQGTVSGNPVPVLIPWIISNPDGNTELMYRAVAGTVDISPEAEQAYLQSTSSLDLTTKEKVLVKNVRR